MTSASLIKKLKSLGTAQNRKVMARHGAPDNYLGVSFANLEKIKKQIFREFKKDSQQRHQLALDLFESGIPEAQILSAMTADPRLLKRAQAKRMMKDITFFMISNYLGGLFARTSFAIAFMEEEMKSKKEFIRHNGYDILGTILKNGELKITKTQCRKYLKTIEKEIHTSPNRGKSAMNAALICMGTYRDDMHKEVIAAAERIGKVEVDHGDTSCKTPDAISYITKSRKK